MLYSLLEHGFMKDCSTTGWFGFTEMIETKLLQIWIVCSCEDVVSAGRTFLSAQYPIVVRLVERCSIVGSSTA